MQLLQFQQLEKETLEGLDWCLNQLSTMKTRMSSFLYLQTVFCTDVKVIAFLLNILNNDNTYNSYRSCIISKKTKFCLY